MVVRLERNDRVRLRDRLSSDELRGHLGLDSIRNAVQKRRLRWFGHVERMIADNWVKKCREFNVTGPRGRGKSRKIWDEVVRSDHAAKSLRRDLALDRATWRSSSEPV